MGDEPVFIFTGRFAARKRVDFLVKAFSRVPEVTLLLVGYFDDRFDPGASFENLQEGNIHMAGPTYDVLPYLQASDVFVSASVAEGMPNAMLEAMACGLPALVSAIPGHLEVVQSGMNGETFVPDNLEDLMQKIRFFIRHRNRLPAYSEAARKTMLQKFSIEAVAEAYQGILSGGCS
jgi:glycosyltransferase involved in cell wall biosynthesis